MNRKIVNFRDLNIWQLGMEIARDIYEVSTKFPREEQFGLISQMRRASVSIPSNIAEGFNRFHNKEYRQFLFTALGSLAELETQIELCSQLNYLDPLKKNELIEKLIFETKMIRSLIKKL